MAMMGTTICAVKRNGKIAIAGDGQVTMGENTIFKNSAKKVRRIYNDQYFAGQMTGVEGYVESASSGLLAGISLARRLRGEEAVDFPTSTAIGALSHYIAAPNYDFQPMNVTFGIIDPLGERIRNKAMRYERISQRALEIVRDLSAKIDN